MIKEPARPADKSKIRVIACGMIAREVMAVNAQLGFDYVDLKCLPADYHFHPEKIAPAMDIAIHKARADGYQDVFVGYADCGTCGELDKVCEKHGVSRIEGPHCFSFYMGNQAFEEADGAYLTTFFITDFLARNFDAFLKRPLGLDRHPGLLEMYFGNYTKALYIAQTDDAQLDERARGAAEFLSLEYERRFTGYGDLVPALAEIARQQLSSAEARAG